MKILGNRAAQPSDESCILETAGLGKTYGHHTVLQDVDLKIHRGQVVAIIGPSGSGKSTLIRCLNLIEKPTTGRIRISGIIDHEAGNPIKSADLKNLRTRVGMVFQSFNLFPNMTALQNVNFAQMKGLRRSRSQAIDVSMRLLEQVGLHEKANFKPSQLSGGQQQRVAIARALALEPEIMLFDEPTSAIDPELRIEVLGVMRRLAGTGMTMVIVTHEIDFAARVADRVIFVSDGRVEEQGLAKELLRHPQKERTKRFLNAVDGIEQ